MATTAMPTRKRRRVGAASTLLVLVSAMATLRESGGAATSECIRKAPSSLKKALREDLCFGAATAGPAECAAFIKTATSFTQRDVLDLCTGAASDAPARCAKSLPNGVSPELKVKLCSPLARAMLTPETTEARTKAPAACYADLPKRFPTPEAVLLCAGATSSAPAQCASAATSALKDFGPSDVAALCRNAPPTTTTGGGSGKSDPTGPVQCVKAAPSKLSGPEHAVALCAEASSSMPAKCIEELKGPSGKMTPEEKIALCKGARSTTPAKCAVSAPTTLDAGLRAKLCARTTSSKAPAACFKETRNALRDELLQVEFCAGAVDDGPAKCVTAAPFNLENKLKVGLCRGARDDGPSE
mmetsp:Transcript_62496/g.171762  ORF Transcript_62496/g.171762 Transcript_62496/m.171762 type:complete len:357 (-) Transcript_62496:455-1525(-)